MSERADALAKERRAQRRAALERLIELDDHGGDPLEILAGELPPALRYAHALLAVLESFDRDVFEARVVPAIPADIAPAPSFESIRAHAEPAPDGGLRLDPGYAERCLERARSGESRTDPGVPTPEALAGFATGVLASMRPSDPDTVRLRLLAAVTPAEALADFDRLFREADQAFLLARCRSLCDAVRGRPRIGAAAGDEELDRAVDERQTYLHGRVASANDFYRTGRYYGRVDLHQQLERWLADGPWALELHAKGGMGKTMLLQWLRARYCAIWEHRIPVARFDFDRAHLGQDDRAPHRVLFSLADALDPLLPRTGSSSPFGSLLQSYRGRESPEFTDHFVSVLRATLGEQGRALILLDTLEDAMHDVERLSPLFDALQRVADKCHGLRLLLAGRYALSEKAPGLWKHLPGAEALALRPFERDEAIAFVEGQCGIADHAVAEAIADKFIERLPFKLVLLAEIAASEGLSADKVAGIDQVDLEYLVVRVLRRLADPALEWVLRYGVVPRRLTFEFLRDVMRPHIERENQGIQVLDDTRQSMDRFQQEERFARGTVRTVTELWNGLLAYESNAAWVFRDAHDPNALRFHQDIRDPMRRLLAGQRVTPLLHRDAATHFEAQARAATDGEGWARAMAERIYHLFKSEPGDRNAAENLVAVIREATERAPSQLLFLAAAAFEGDDLARAEVHRHPDGRPWLTPSEEATVLFLAADGMWSGNQEISPEILDAMVKRAEGIVRGAEGEWRDAGRLALLRREIGARLGYWTTGQPTAQLEAFDLEPSEQQDLAVRYRTFVMETLPAGVLSTPRYREGLRRLFEEALSTPSALLAIRRRIVKTHMRELLDEDRPLDVIDAWKVASSSLGDDIDGDEELWSVGAEAMLRMGEGLPSRVPAGLAALYGARSFLFDKALRAKAMKAALRLEELFTDHDGDWRTLAFETLAEIFARRFDADRLSALHRRAEEVDARCSAVVGVWIARMQLFGFGNVQEAEFFLRIARDAHAGEREDLRFDRDLLAIEIHRRRQEADEADEVFQAAQRDARDARPRHRVAVLLCNPARPPGKNDRLGVALQAVQSDHYRERLVDVYSGRMFESRTVSLAGTIRAHASATAEGRLAQVLRLSPSSSAFLGDVASRPIAAPATIDDIEGGALSHDRTLQLGLRPDVDEVVLEAPVELASLPYEILLDRDSSVRPRILARRRRVASGSVRPVAGPHAVTIVIGNRSIQERYLPALRKFYREHNIRGDVERGRIFHNRSPILHLIDTFMHRGSAVFLENFELHAAHLAKILEHPPALVILDVPEGGSLPVRQLLLRNAFAAQLVEIAPIPVVLAVGPVKRRDAMPGIMAGAVAAFSRGESTPVDLWRAVRAADADDDWSDHRGLLTSRNTALFCDHPHETYFERE